MRLVYLWIVFTSLVLGACSSTPNSKTNPFLPSKKSKSVSSVSKDWQSEINQFYQTIRSTDFIYYVVTINQVIDNPDGLTCDHDTFDALSRALAFNPSSLTAHYTFYECYEDAGATEEADYHLNAVEQIATALLMTGTGDDEHSPILARHVNELVYLSLLVDRVYLDFEFQPVDDDLIAKVHVIDVSERKFGHLYFTVTDSMKIIFGDVYDETQPDRLFVNNVHKFFLDNKNAGAINYEAAKKLKTGDYQQALALLEPLKDSSLLAQLRYYQAHLLSGNFEEFFNGIDTIEENADLGIPLAKVMLAQALYQLSKPQDNGTEAIEAAKADYQQVNLLLQETDEMTQTGVGIRQFAEYFLHSPTPIEEIVLWQKVSNQTLAPRLIYDLAELSLTMGHVDASHTEELYRLAADSGSVDAMYRIARQQFAYMMDPFVKSEVLNYLTQAADKDHASATKTLADWYWFGEHVKQNKRKACGLYQQAQALGVDSDTLDSCMVTQQQDGK